MQKSNFNHYIEDDIAITKWETSGNKKIRITFDTGVSCLLYRGEARRFRLTPEGTIDKTDYEQIMNEVLGKRAKKRALHLLEQMDRTEAGLREKLEAGEYPAECIDEAISYVKRFHYLDDTRYAENYVRYKGEKMSRMQIKQKLSAKGISREIIDAVLEEQYQGDESQQIQALLKKRGFSRENCEQKEFQRTYQFLMRRGFRSSDVLSAMK